MLAHKVVDSLTQKGLDTPVSVEGELVERSADGRAEIANDSLFPLARVSGLRCRLSQSRFLYIRGRWGSSRRTLLESCEPTAHASPRFALTSLCAGILTCLRTQAHREATSSAALPLGSISGAVLPAPTL